MNGDPKRKDPIELQLFGKPLNLFFLPFPHVLASSCSSFLFRFLAVGAAVAPPGDGPLTTGEGVVGWGRQLWWRLLWLLDGWGWWRWCHPPPLDGRRPSNAAVAVVVVVDVDVSACV